MSTLVVGVAGGTGSGKTTLVRALAEKLGKHAVTVIEHDAYYRPNPNLKTAERAGINYDHPDALETTLLVEHLRQLKQDLPVEIPRYDFVRHRRLPTGRRVDPKPVVLVEGILVLSVAELRQLMDLRIFVETGGDLRFIRRLQRDALERGRSAGSVVDQYLASVRPMHREFVQPSKRFADMVIAGEGELDVSVRSIIDRLETMLSGHPGGFPPR